MDIEEFEKRVQPRAKRSKLEPFRAQIFELKAKGYADWQVRDWLAANGVEVSRQAVQLFVAKRKGLAAGPAPSTRLTGVPASQPATAQGAAKAADLDVRKMPEEASSESSPASMVGGKLASETILETPSKSYSFKQLQKAKDSK